MSPEQEQTIHDAAPMLLALVDGMVAIQDEPNELISKHQETAWRIAADDLLDKIKEPQA